MIGPLGVGRALLALLPALTACDQIFDLEEVGAPPDVAPAVVGERPSFCSSGPLLDRFETDFCYWAATYKTEHFAQHDGVLDIVGDGTVSFFAGCTGYFPLPFTDNGMFAHIPRVMDSASGYTEIQIRNSVDTTPSMQATIVHGGGKLLFRVNDVTQMERDDAPPWWRLRRPGLGTTVTAEVSYDGITWELFGSATADMPPSFAIDMGAGISSTPSTAGMATFAALGVCD